MPTAIEQRWIELPYSLTAAAIMGAATLTWMAVSPISTLRFGSLALAILSVACLLYGFAIHFGSIGSRYAKYELLTAGIYAFWLAGVFDYLPENSSPLNVTELTLVKMAIVSLILAFFTTIQIITSLFFPAWSVRPGLLPSMKMVRAQKLCKGIGIPLIVISAFLTGGLLLLPYLPLRYVVGKRLEKAPIIYLRCFGYSEGPSALGLIIAKVATRFGVLFAIVHPRQRGSDLLFKSQITEQSLVAVVPDKDWQEFIVSKLNICSAVIIDRTVPSHSLEWEITKSIELVDRSRIAILQKRGTAAGPVPSDVWVLEYGLGGKNEKEARKALSTWFENLFLQKKGWSTVVLSETVVPVKETI